MATPPIYVGATEVVWTTSGASKTSGPIAVQAGDRLAVFAAAEGIAGINAISDSAGNNTWSKDQEQTAATNSSDTSLFTTTVTSTGTLTVTISPANGGGEWGFTVMQWRASDGFGPSVLANWGNVAPSAPSAGLTTLAPNSTIAMIVSDFAAGDGASRAYRSVNGSVGTEVTYARDAIAYTVYANRWADVGAAGAKTIGLTAPTSQWTIIALEVKGTDPPVSRPRIPLHPPGPFRSPMGRKFPLPRPPRGQVDVSTGVTYDKAGGGVMDTLAGGDKVLGHEYAKTGGAVSDLDGGGADVRERVKAGGAVSDLDGGGAKLRERTKTGGAVTDFDGGAAKVREKAKAGGATSDLDGGAAKIREKPKTGGAVSDLDGGGAKARDRLKAGGATSDVDGGAAKVREKPKTGGAVVVLVGGGPAVRNASGLTYTKSGGGTSALDGGGAKARTATKAGGAVSDLDAGAARIREIPKTGGGTFRWDGGGASAQGAHVYVKAGGGILGAGSVAGGASLGFQGGGPSAVVIGAAPRRTHALRITQRRREEEELALAGIL